MVILTVVTKENPHTVYFEPYPIPKPSYIWLLSCSLYNSWFNLKEGGKIFYTDDKKIKDLNPFCQVIIQSKKWQKHFKILLKNMVKY